MTFYFLYVNILFLFHILHQPSTSLFVSLRVVVLIFFRRNWAVIHRVGLQETEDRRGLEHQVEALAGQLSGERSAVRSLEETLNQKRRTEWSSEASIKQLEVEKSQLQRKVSALTVVCSYAVPLENMSVMFTCWYHKTLIWQKHVIPFPQLL